jgi:hypothetical protein
LSLEERFSLPNSGLALCCPNTPTPILHSSLDYFTENGGKSLLFSGSKKNIVKSSWVVVFPGFTGYRFHWTKEFA